MGSHWGSIVFRYLPHGMSIITHTSRSSSLERSEYRLGRSAGTASLCVRRPAWASRRLAVLLPIPSDSHILSRMTPFCFFDALMYSSLNLRVTCLFAAMLIPSSIRPAKQTNPVSRSLLLRHHYAIRAQKREARRNPRKIEDKWYTTTKFSRDRGVRSYEPEQLWIGGSVRLCLVNCN